MLSLLPSADLRSCLPSVSCVLGPGMVLGLPFHSTRAVYLMTLGWGWWQPLLGGVLLKVR